MAGGRGPLKVTVVRGGGLAGLVSSTAVDTSALASADAAALRARVQRASLADTQAGAPQPDRELVEILIEDDDGAVTAMNADELSPGVRELIEWVESAPDRTEQLGPPGP
ncbi:hypothetical protein LX86_003218 [Lentzea aerocolonigenes]|nr:hypothetical protein [Lentzea aerocolonigenes]